METKTGNRRYIKILFDDGQTLTYDMREFSREDFDSDDQYLQYLFTLDRAEDSLIERFKTVGREVNKPLIDTPQKMRARYGDLRRFNGNHATGKGRKPPVLRNPKFVKVVERGMYHE